MRVHAETPAHKLLPYPEALEALDWFGIELTPYEHQLTLEELCEANGVDVEDLLIDLQAALDGEEADEDEAGDDHDDEEDEDEYGWDDEDWN